MSGGVLPVVASGPALRQLFDLPFGERLEVKRLAGLAAALRAAVRMWAAISSRNTAPASICLA